MSSASSPSPLSPRVEFFADSRELPPAGRGREIAEVKLGHRRKMINQPRTRKNLFRNVLFDPRLSLRAFVIFPEVFFFCVRFSILVRRRGRILPGVEADRPSRPATSFGARGRFPSSWGINKRSGKPAPSGRAGGGRRFSPRNVGEPVIPLAS